MWNVECKMWSVECRACDATRLKCSLPHKMTIEISKMLAAPATKNCNSSCETDTTVLRPPHKTTFDTLSNRLPLLPGKNDMTICLETFEKERFCSFPHKATGKPETRDETRGNTKTSISCETSSKFDTL